MVVFQVDWSIIQYNARFNFGSERGDPSSRWSLKESTEYCISILKGIGKYFYVQTQFLLCFVLLFKCPS